MPTCHWPAEYHYQSANPSALPDQIDVDNWDKPLIGAGNYETGPFWRLSQVPPLASYAYTTPGLGSPTTPGSPLTITPTTQLGLATGVGSYFRWFAQALSGTINMHALTDTLADHPDYLNFNWDGQFYLIDDITGYCSNITIPFGAGEMMEYTVQARVKITADGVVSYVANTDHYHNGYLYNQNGVYVGTAPVALDFTLLNVPAHHTLYWGAAGSGGYTTNNSTGTKTYPAHHPAGSTLKFELEVTVTQAHYSSGTGLTYTTTTFLKDPDQIVLVYEKTSGTARYGGTAGTSYAGWLSSDLWDGQLLASAWTNNQGASLGCYVAFCPSARGGAFEATQTLETVACKEVGLTYLASGRCYLSYKVLTSGAYDTGTYTAYYRTSDTFGRGNWTARQALASGQTLAQNSGRGMGSAFRLELKGLDADGSCTLWHNRDGTGVLWHQHALANAYGPTGACCWLGNGWGVLVREASTGKVFFRRVYVIDMDDPAPVDTGCIGWPIAITQLRNGILYGEIRIFDNTGATLTGNHVSRDRGLHWTNPGGALFPPPGPYTTNPDTLTNDGDVYFLSAGPGLVLGLIPL